VSADPDLTSASEPSVAEVRSDGAFEFRGLNGPRRILIRQMPASWTLKSVHANGADLTDKAIAFGTSAQSLTDVAIAVTTRGGAVTGSAIDSNGRAATDYAVLLYATSSDLWYADSRFVRMTRPIDGGQFTINGLPPGQYYVAAVEWLKGDDTGGEWQDSRFLDSLAAHAMRVSVPDGQNLSVKLPLVKRPF
jgi:hypothetical protein